MTFLMPSNDPVLTVVEFGSYKSYTFSPAAGDVIAKEHPFSFTAEDSDGNRKTFNLTFNVIGNDCAYSCSGCIDEWSCSKSTKECTYEDGCKQVTT